MQFKYKSEESEFLSTMEIYKDNVVVYSQTPVNGLPKYLLFTHKNNISTMEEN